MLLMMLFVHTHACVCTYYCASCVLVCGSKVLSMRIRHAAACLQHGGGGMREAWACMGMQHVMVVLMCWSQACMLVCSMQVRACVFVQLLAKQTPPLCRWRWCVLIICNHCCSCTTSNTRAAMQQRHSRCACGSSWRCDDT